MIRIRESGWWLGFLVAGLVGLAFLVIHLGVFHLPRLLLGRSYSEVLSFQLVVERARDPFFTASYIVLLGALLYHGLYGLRGLLLELFPGRAARRAISWGAALLGLALFAYGTYTTILAAQAPI